MSVDVLGINVAVTHRGQSLDAKEKTIQKPLRHRGAADAVSVEAVENRENQIERDVNNRDKSGELRPAQAQQPPVNVTPAAGVGVDLDEFHRPRPYGNLMARSPSHLAKCLVEIASEQMWLFKKVKL